MPCVTVCDSAAKGISTEANSTVINRHDTQLSDLVVLDAVTWEQVGMVKLPLRVRPGLHGNFVLRNSMLDPDAPLADYEWVPAKVSHLCTISLHRRLTQYATETSLMAMLTMPLLVPRSLTVEAGHQCRASATTEASTGMQHLLGKARMDTSTGVKRR